MEFLWSLGAWCLLVWCLAIDWCFAARNFRFPRGASDEHTLQRSVRSEQRSGRRKGLRPGGLRRKRPGASLLLAHRALRLCSLVAPCPRPFWAQRNTSQLRDTTLASAQNPLPRMYSYFGDTTLAAQTRGQSCPRSEYRRGLRRHGEIPIEWNSSVVP